MSFNQIQIVGNCGSDPELRYTPTGTAVCNISVAVNEKEQNKQTHEFEDVTTWFRCTIWGKQAENAAKYLAKGDAVFFQGRMRLDHWTSREGDARVTIEVNVDKMQFLPNGKKGGSERENYTQQANEGGQPQYSGEPQASNVPAEFR